MRNVDTERLRMLADRRPGLVRRVLSGLIFQLPNVALGGCVGGIVGAVVAAAQLPWALAVAVAVVVALGVARLADEAWCRAAGLRRPGTVTEDTDVVELDLDELDADENDLADDEVDDEPARRADPAPTVDAATR